MRGRRSDAGVALVEVLAVLAVGCLVLMAAVGIGSHMFRSWEQDTARAASQRTFLTVLDTITNTVHAAQELRVEDERLVVKGAGGEDVTFYMEGDQLKAQRGDAAVTLARGVSGFHVASTGSGVRIRITIGTGANAESFEIRSDLPPWKQDWGGGRK